MSGRDPSAPRAFINYRIKDSQQFTTALYRDLKRVFGEGSVFLDQKELEPGEPYPANLKSELHGASVLLAVVGPQWLTVQGPDGIRRLDEPGDWVRLELELALEKKIPILPIVVDSTPMPKAAAFSTIPKLVPFAEILPLRLDARDWEAHFGKLVAWLVEKGFRESIRSVASSGSTRRRPFASTVPVRGNAPFEGRDELLSHLHGMLGGAGSSSLVALHGPSGVGKSELAREYARRHLADYPGGTFVVSFRSAGIPTDLASLGGTVLGLTGIGGLSLEDRCRSALLGLGDERCLLIYDDVQKPEDVKLWIPGTGGHCDVLATTACADFDHHWRNVRVDFLTPESAVKIVTRMAGPELASRFSEQLIRQAEGLPVQLVPATQALVHAAAGGGMREPATRLSKETTLSFEGPWAILGADARLLLSGTLQLNTESISEALLISMMLKGCGWESGRTVQALDLCRNLFVLEGGDFVRLHSLWAAFVREHQAFLDQPTLAALRKTIWEALSTASKAYDGDPANLDKLKYFLEFSTEWEAWVNFLDVIQPDPGVEGWISTTLLNAGRFRSALLWLERSVERKNKGDVDGRVDHKSLSISLHQMGYCLTSVGMFDEARPWFDRAAKETRQGHIHGWVDHESFGMSLHQVGYCLASIGKFDEARQLFEEAVKEKKQGNLYGRVDRESLGMSLSQVGHCLFSTGKFDEAQSCFERSVEEASHGNLHGRVNHASMGINLNEVGRCLMSVGKYDEARYWFERAVEEKSYGDDYGRVDYADLSTSLNLVGDCLLSTNKHEEARSWFERAVEESKKGDVHGRVDRTNVARTLHQVGCCLCFTGKHEDAQPWFERALESAKLGDIHGRVDHEALGRVLHQLGYCRTLSGKHEEAWKLYKRAADEARQGDIHGRVNHLSLGSSLHQVGYCMRCMEMYDEARQWFELAVEEKRRGDFYGRVDHESLGRSLHQVGDCLSSTGKREEALQWFESAVKEKKQGDVHGRVDCASLELSRRDLAVVLESPECI